MAEAYHEYGNSSRPSRCTCISDLNERTGTNWTIEAKLLQKELLPYSGRTGDGYRLVMHFKDVTGEIKTVMFEKEEADGLHNLFQQLCVGALYIVSDGKINVKYNTKPNPPPASRKQRIPRLSDYEAVLQSGNSGITPSASTSSTRAQHAVDPIANLKQMAEIGWDGDIVSFDKLVVLEVGEEYSGNTRNDNRAYRRMTLTLGDMTSKCAVEVTLWNEDVAKAENLAIGDFVAVTDALVSEYNGYLQLKLRQHSRLEQRADKPLEARAVKEVLWENITKMDTTAKDGSAGPPCGTGCTPVPSMKAMLNSVQKNGPGNFMLLCTITSYPGALLPIYTSCNRPKCKSAVEFDESSGCYHCAKCATYDEACTYRYRLSMELSDLQGNTAQCTAFGVVPENCFGGKQASTLHEEYERDIDATTAWITEKEIEFMNDSSGNKRVYVGTVRAKLDERPQTSALSSSAKRFQSAGTHQPQLNLTVMFLELEKDAGVGEKVMAVMRNESEGSEAAHTTDGSGSEKQDVEKRVFRSQKGLRYVPYSGESLMRSKIASGRGSGGGGGGGSGSGSGGSGDGGFKKPRPSTAGLMIGSL